MGDEPQKHLTPLGNIPDWIDGVHKSADAKKDDYIKQAVAEYKTAIESVKNGCKANTFSEGARDIGRAWVHGTVGLGEFWLGAGTSAVNSYAKLTFHTDTFDVFRLGDSYYERNALGIIKDVLRVLNLLPIFGGAGGKVAAAMKEGVMVTQEGGTAVCSLVTINNALAETGQGFMRGKQYFVNIEEVARAQGLLERIKEFGAGAEDLRRLAGALKEVNVAVEEVAKPLAHLEEGVGVLEDLGRERPNGIFIVAIKFGEPIVVGSTETRTAGHVLAAQFVRGKGLMFLDTDRRVWQGVAELAREYPNVILGPKDPILFMKNTWLVQVYKSPIFNIFLPTAVWGGRTGAQEQTHAFFGPPHRSTLVERRPLGWA